MNMPSLNRRQLLKNTAVLAAMTSVPAWALAQDTTRLRAAISGFGVINTLDPAKMSLISEAYVVYALYNSLLKFDAQMRLQADLAQSWEIVDDKTVQFNLRRDVVFHNGEPLTADDVAFTLERLMNPDLASPNRSKVELIDRVQILDVHTVRIHTRQAYAPLLAFLTNSRTGTQIVSRKAVQDLGDAAFAKNPVGTGAYRLQRWDAGRGVALAANPAYFDGKPQFQQIEIPLIPEESSGVTALLGGQVELISTAPFAQVPELEQTPGVHVLKSPGLNTRFINLNVRKAPCDNVHFRRALSMAFQRDAMVKVVLFGEGEALHNFVPSALTQYHSAISSPYTGFNPEQARAELAKSNWDKNQPLPVLTWGAGWWKRFAEVFVAQVNATLGTRLMVEVTDPNAAYARQQSGDYFLGIWGWIGLVDPDEYLRDLFHTKGWKNFAGYSNPALDTLLDQAVTVSNLDQRTQLYAQAQEIIAQDVPAIACFSSNIHNLITDKVSGFTQKPYANFGDQFVRLRSV